MTDNPVSHPLAQRIASLRLPGMQAAFLEQMARHDLGDMTFHAVGPVIAQITATGGLLIEPPADRGRMPFPIGGRPDEGAARIVLRRLAADVAASDGRRREPAVR